MTQSTHPDDPIPAPSKREPLALVATSHWLSLLGLGLVLSAVLTWLFLIPLQLRDNSQNPYFGLVAFIVVPIVLLVGIVLTPIGIYRGRRRLAKRLMTEGVQRKSAWGRLAVFFGVVTLVNLAIGSQVTYRAVRHMEEPQFCGSCHVMAPEFAAHEVGPHARLKCVECHVGNGATGWFASKMRGTHQLFDVVFDRYPRPILSALEENKLVPAAETCEECHWREKPSAIRVRVLQSFAEDAGNTPSETVLTMHVGGRAMGGIHGRHLGAGVEIRFAAEDAKRQEIPWVEYRNAMTGVTHSYSKAGVTAEHVAGLSKFTMQCVDCHNRPAHTFQLPERAIDEAFAQGDLPTTLPWLKHKAVEILKATYASNAEAQRKIPEALSNYYRSELAEVQAARGADIEKAGSTLAAIYARNVFPDLGVKWGTYPNNLGHTDFPGCFRCHQGDHTTSDGLELTKNCAACHYAAAVDEAAPEILQSLGLDKQLKKMRKK